MSCLWLGASVDAGLRGRGFRRRPILARGREVPETSPATSRAPGRSVRSATTVTCSPRAPLTIRSTSDGPNHERAADLALRSTKICVTPFARAKARSVSGDVASLEHAGLDPQGPREIEVPLESLPLGRAPVRPGPDSSTRRRRGTPRGGRPPRGGPGESAPRVDGSGPTRSSSRSGRSDDLRRRRDDRRLVGRQPALHDGRRLPHGQLAQRDQRRLLEEVLAAPRGRARGNRRRRARAG